MTTFHRVILIALFLLACTVPSLQAADANPPDRMTYQGYLVDANGNALAQTNPKNYDVIFRIYDASSAGNRIWTEQQTVTVDKGYFSVLLGEGSAVAGEDRPNLSTVFSGASASDRFIAIAVKLDGINFTDIVPRLRLLPSPYSFLAKSAVSLVSNNGTPLATVATGSLQVSAPVDVAGALSATTLSGNGANVTQINANNVTTGTLDANRVPGLDGAKITTGTIADARLSSNIPKLNNASSTFTGTVTANTFAGNGIIPIGGIIMWSGTVGNVPAGWRLCDGGGGTPDLRGRFIVGAGGAYAVGTVGGNTTVALSINNMPQHTHNYYDVVWSENDGTNLGQVGSHSGTDFDNHWYYRYSTTEASGGGQAFDIRPPFYALAYIMRTN